MANNIKEFRKSHGLTQAELAQKLGITTSAVGMYETGARNPSYEVLIKLSNIFDAPLDEIVDITIEPSSDVTIIGTKSDVKLTELSYQTFQIEYIHPQKIRALIKKKFRMPSIEAAQKVQKAIQYLLNDESFHHIEMKDIAKKALLKDENYKNIRVPLDDFPFIENGFVEGIIRFFYEDIKDTKEKTINFIEEKIELPSNAPRIIFLGKVGVGKSTMIKNFTNFSSDINFPFTDTSRTTTYQTEYIFKDRRQKPNKFAVSFMSFDEVTQEVEIAIDRAVESKIDMHYEEKSFNDEISIIRKESEQDRIIKAFYTDPNNVFDMRFLIGRYHRSNSKNRLYDNDFKQTDLWDKIYNYILTIINEVEKSDFTSYNYNDYKYDTPASESQEFMRHKYYEYALDSYNNKSSTYNLLKKYVLTEIKLNFNNLLLSLERNLRLSKRTTHKDQSNDWPLGFYCVIDDYDSYDFKDFINTFTSREGSDFGRVLTPLVKEMRIELPYNSNLSRDLTQNPIVFIDTIGISHSAEEGSSIENSINLNLDAVDIITVVDDSKTSMQADTLNIIKHLTNRVARSKIFMAYTFYDDFTKKEFINDYDEDEDYVDIQKQDYLLSIQNNRIAAILKDDRQEIIKFLINLKEKTIFMKGLVSSNSDRYYSHSTNYDAINNYLKKVHAQYNIYNNYLLVEKVVGLPLIEYDYKRLAMIFFNEILEKYMTQQKGIYINNPPHYKVTEALTRRLSNGQTYYVGAESLKPVDDLYSIMLDNLYSFILNPKAMNFEKRDSNGDNYKTRLLEKLKEDIFENLAKYLKEDFTSFPMQQKWRELYLDTGIGSDHRRREGFIKTINELLIPYTSYIVNPQVEHMIDKLELLFERCIMKLDEDISQSK